MLFGLIFVVSALAGTAVWFLVGPAASGEPAGRGVPASGEPNDVGGGACAARRERFEAFDVEALRRERRR